jgi:hypothetical protein
VSLIYEILLKANVTDFVDLEWLTQAFFSTVKFEVGWSQRHGVEADFENKGCLCVPSHSNYNFSFIEYL